MSVFDTCVARRPDTKWSIWQKTLCTEIAGNQPFQISDPVLISEGDNYAFVIFDGELTFTLKDGDGFYYRFFLQGDPPTYQLVEITPDSPAPTPIAASGNNFQFTPDNFMRFKEFTEFPVLHYPVSVDDLLVEIIYGTGVPSNPAIASDANTYNTRFMFTGANNSFLFKGIDSQILYFPTVVLSPGPIIQLVVF